MTEQVSSDQKTMASGNDAVSGERVAAPGAGRHSDTPKTDAVVFRACPPYVQRMVVDADFAREQERTLNEALDLLEAFYDTFEEGPACYEDPDEFAGYLGNAVKLDDSIDSRILALLHKHRPRDLS